jgi:hypothetical protein
VEFLGHCNYPIRLITNCLAVHLVSEKSRVEHGARYVQYSNNHNCTTGSIRGGTFVTKLCYIETEFLFRRAILTHYLYFEFCTVHFEDSLSIAHQQMH